MLESLQIRNFKAFADLRIGKLSRLNLFVGSNNVGKTCLLEAVRLWNANGSPAVVRDLIRFGNDSARRRFRSETYETDDTDDMLGFLFHGFADRAREIAIGPIDSSSDMLRISLGRYVRVQESEAISRRISVEEAIELGEDVTSAETYLRIDSPQLRRFLYPISSIWRRPFRNTAFDDLPPVKTTVVPASGLNGKEVALLWDRVTLTPAEGQILECLQLIDKRINGISLVSDANSYSEERVPIVSFTDRMGRFPLKTMGDGLSRIFHIALAMVSAENGTVLIDEFENGLYWKVQRRLWAAVFEMASKFNVQVFATTHSTDCLRAFASSARDITGISSVYRLEEAEDIKRAALLPIGNILDALESDVEVR